MSEDDLTEGQKKAIARIRAGPARFANSSEQLAEEAVEIATVLHISDLHFVENLKEKGSRFRWTTKGLLTESHAFQKVEALRIALLLKGETYDIVLGTGDISTDGSKEALRTALRFIETKEIRETQQTNRIQTLGLEAGATRRIILPGNHDRYTGKLFPPRQTVSHEFEEVFKSPNRNNAGRVEYPYVIGFRRKDRKNDPEATTLLFFVFDSTPPATEPFWFFDKIACGHVTKGECQWLYQKAQELVNDKSVIGLDGEPLRFNPENTIRIAVLHHHPVVDQAAAQNFRTRLTSLENNRTFVEYCFNAGINIVLFGHEHIQYRLTQSPPPSVVKTPFGKAGTIYFLCCPSTLQYSEPKNGFFLTHFYSDRTFSGALYEWDGLSFTRKEKDLFRASL